MNKRKIVYPSDIVKEIIGNDESVDIKTAEQNFEINLERLFKHNYINERELEFIIRYYKFGETLDSIGKKHNLTRERVRQVIAKTLHKLRSPARIRYFKYGYKIAEKENESIRKELNTINCNDSIEELDLSARSYNSLSRAGIKTIHELRELNHDELMSIRSMGVKCVKEIEDKFRLED